MENYSANRLLNNIIGELQVVCKESKQMNHTIDTRKRKREEQDEVVVQLSDLSKGTVLEEELRCTWTGSLKDLEHHLSTTCQFTSVKCKSCGSSMKRHELDQHMTIHDLKPCPACQEMVPGGNHDHRIGNCKKKLRKCFHCNDSFPYEDYQSHNEVCDMVEEDCPYRSITSCTYRLFLFIMVCYVTIRMSTV
jgi:hypothetical protein